MLRKSPGAAPGAPGQVLGSYSESSLFWSFLGGKSRLASGNGEMLQNDDSLNDNATFLRSQGLEHEV